MVPATREILSLAALRLAADIRPDAHVTAMPEGRRSVRTDSPFSVDGICVASTVNSSVPSGGASNGAAATHSRFAANCAADETVPSAIVPDTFALPW